MASPPPGVAPPAVPPYREASSALGAALERSGPEAPVAVRAAAFDAYALSLNELATNVQAEAAARESLALRRSVDDLSGCASSLSVLASVKLRVHQVDEAYGYDDLLFEALNGLAAVAAVHRRDDVAAMLSGAADVTSVERHDPIIAARLDDQFFAPARSRLGDQPWRDVYAAGTMLDREQAVDAALRSIRLHAVA